MPYPAFEPGFLAIVNRALTWAWATLRQRSSDEHLREVAEVQITEAMQTVLNQAMNDALEPVEGFTAAYFETMERGGEIANYDGTRLEKRPDLRFRLRGRHNVSDRLQYAFFVECKIVDATHAVLRYCNEGLARFIRGDYAWAMPHAMMLAYVRDRTYSVQALKQLLENDNTQYAVTSVSVPEATEALGSVESVHKRPWRYPVTDSEPGPIEIRHLWLLLSSEN